MKSQWWLDDLPQELVDLQVDISCLVDGELDEAAACRVMEQLERNRSCKEFFEDCLLQVRLHKDMSDPSRLLERFAALTGRSVGDGLASGSAAHGDPWQKTPSGETPWQKAPSQKTPWQRTQSLELVHQLATIFYKIGKAYVLSDLDPEYRVRVFEKAVEVESTKRWGRGFVDGVISRGGQGPGLAGVDLQSARHMLNGRLSKIEGAHDKGVRLLREALSIDPEHEEARLYLAFVHAHAGRRLRAEKEFRHVFDSALDEANRGHAAVQLGMLYFAEREYRKAIGYLRWLLVTGLEAREERFFFVRFNIGVYYAHWRKPEKALRYFRELLDHHPERVEDVSELFLEAPTLRPVIESQPGFAEALLERCPELFGASADVGPPAGADGPGSESEGDPSSREPSREPDGQEDL